MGQICLDDAYRQEYRNPPPGVVKRHDNFTQTIRKTGTGTRRPVSRLDIERALFCGTPGLSGNARSLLAFYLVHLDIKRASGGATSVWPGNAAACTALGKTDATIRRLKGELEKAGMIVRKYDRRNRPLEGGAIDLAPFLAELPAILKEVEERCNERRANWKESRMAGECSACAEISGYPLKNARLNSNRNNTDSCKAVENREKGKTAPVAGVHCEQIPPSPPSGQHAKPEGRISVPEDADDDFLQQALVLSPRLKRVVDPDNTSLSASEAVDRMPDALPVLFPSDSRHSMTHTFRWCLQRHGMKAFVFLAVALEDPSVRDGRRLFGWFATRPADCDLSRNIERIRCKLSDVDAVPALDLPANGTGQDFARAFSELTSIAKYNAWFSSKRTRIFREGDTLVIEMEQAVAVDMIENRFATPLHLAAQRLGLEQYRIRKAACGRLLFCGA